MANPTVFIEIKTIGADKAEKSVKKITTAVGQAEKATQKLKNTTKTGGDVAEAAARKALAAEARRGRQIEANRLAMDQFKASVRAAGADSLLSARVGGSFKALERKLGQDIKPQEATRAINQFQTVLLKAKGELLRFKEAEMKAATAGEKMATSQRKAVAVLRQEKTVLFNAEQKLKDFNAQVKRMGGDTQLLARAKVSYNALGRAIIAAKGDQDKITAAVRRFQSVLNQGNRDLKDQTAAMRKAAIESKKFGTIMDKAGQPTKGLSNNLRNLGSSAVFAVGPLSGIGARINAFGAISSRTGIKVALLAIGITALIVLLVKSVKAFAAAETGLLKFEALLIATNNATGTTVAELDRLAIAFAKATLNSVKTGRQILGVFTSFRIPINLMTRAAEAAESLAAIMGTDTVGAARLLGRALDDPAQSAESLRRILGTLDQELKFQLLRLTSLGLKWEAQNLLLEEIEKRSGKVAKTLTRGMAGALDAVADAATQLLETLGELAFFKAITKTVFNLAKGIELLTKAIDGSGSAWTGFKILVVAAVVGIRDAVQGVFEFIAQASLNASFATEGALSAYFSGTARIFSDFAKRAADGTKIITANMRKITKVLTDAADVKAALLAGPVAFPQSRNANFGRKPGDLGIETLNEILKKTRDLKLEFALADAEAQIFFQGFTVFEPGVLKLAAARGILKDVINDFKNFGVINKELLKFNNELRKLRQLKEARALFKSTRTEAEKFATSLKKLNVLLAAGALKLPVYSRAVKQLRTTLVSADPILSKFKDTFDKIGGGIAEAMSSTESFGMVMKRVLKGIVDDLIRMIIQLGVVNEIFNTLFNTSFPTLGGSGGALAAFFGLSGTRTGAGGKTAGATAITTGTTNITSAGLTSITAAGITNVTGSGSIFINNKGNIDIVNLGDVNINFVNTLNINSIAAATMNTGLVTLNAASVNVFGGGGIGGAFSGGFGGFFEGDFNPFGSGGGFDIPGPFSHGGGFKVGGSGPSDSKFVPLSLSPGEVVDVRTSQQTKRGGDTFIVDMRGADKDAVLELERFVKSLDASIEKRAVAATTSARQANPRLFGGS